MIHGIDLSLLDQTLNYQFIHGVSYAFSIFRCLALSSPSDFGFVQPTASWPFTATEIIWMAQIQRCCLHTTLAKRKVIGKWCVCGCTVLLFCTCALGQTYSLHLLCQAQVIFMAYSASPRCIMRMVFLQRHKIDFVWSDTKWNDQIETLFGKENYLRILNSCSYTIMNYFRILCDVVIKDMLHIFM